MWLLLLLVVALPSLSGALLVDLPLGKVWGVDLPLGKVWGVDLPLGKVWGEPSQGFDPTGRSVKWTSYTGIPFVQLSVPVSVAYGNQYSVPGMNQHTN